MAFDMYAGPYSEAIGHHEEFVLQLAYDPEEGGRYSQLSQLWESFYDGPHLSPQQSNLLVHELIALQAQHGSANKELGRIVFRLIAFFSAAYTFNLEVVCGSD